MQQPPPGYGAPAPYGAPQPQGPYVIQPQQQQWGAPPPPYAAPGQAPPMMQAPQAQMMQADLQQVHGVVIRQVATWTEKILQGFGVPYEAKNKYAVMPLPPGIRAAKTPDEPGRWRPTSGELESLPLLMRVEEDSDTCTRIVLAYVGWLNLRGLTMHYWDASGERYRSTRDCACGGCMGCPSELVMWQGSTQLGKAVEDQNCGNWCTRCCQACCLCTMFTKVLANMGGPQLTPRYRLRVNICCCGRVNNCCGATCCKDDAVYDILDMDGNLVATIQKTYGRSAPGAGCCGADACCRSANDFDNYIVEFPKDATPTDKALLINAMIQTDYLLFEATGGDNNGGDNNNNN